MYIGAYVYTHYFTSKRTEVSYSYTDTIKYQQHQSLLLSGWCSRRQEEELRKTEENIYDIKSRNQFYCIQDLKHTVPIASWPFG